MMIPTFPRALAFAPWIAAIAMSLAVGGCFGVTPGAVHTGGDDDPFVTIEAGRITLPNGALLFSAYVVDRSTHTCWLAAWDALSPLSCCAARRATGVAEHITWETDASCASPPVAP